MLLLLKIRKNFVTNHKHTRCVFAGIPKKTRHESNLFKTSHVPWPKLLILGMVIPPFNMHEKPKTIPKTHRIFQWELIEFHYSSAHPPTPPGRLTAYTRRPVFWSTTRMVPSDPPHCPIRPGTRWVISRNQKPPWAWWVGENTRWLVLGAPSCSKTIFEPFQLLPPLQRKEVAVETWEWCFHARISKWVF